MLIGSPNVPAGPEPPTVRTHEQVLLGQETRVDPLFQTPRPPEGKVVVQPTGASGSPEKR